MRKFKHQLLFIALIGVLAVGCKKDEVVPTEGVNHQGYFPVQTGRYRIYDVDSIQFYDVTLTSDTFRFQIKEEVNQIVLVADDLTESKSWYEIKIYRRSDTSQAWQQTGYSMQAVSSKTGETIKDNLHFINVSFPVVLNKTWKGNAYLTDSLGSPFDPDWDYTFTTVDTMFHYEGMMYDSCAVVTQFDSQNQITKDIEREAYCHGIGLVYKNSTHVERQTVDLSNWIPEKGRIVTYQLREHN